MKHRLGDRGLQCGGGVIEISTSPSRT
jgi:hypothetical protein